MLTEENNNASYDPDDDILPFGSDDDAPRGQRINHQKRVDEYSVKISQGFTNKNGVYVPWPSLEILRNGNMWGEEEWFYRKNPHFSYGLPDWRLILNSLDVIKIFFDSDGQNPMKSIKREFLRKSYSIKMEIMRKSNFRVAKPYPPPSAVTEHKVLPLC